jgi:hypothetical protein
VFFGICTFASYLHTSLSLSEYIYIMVSTDVEAAKLVPGQITGLQLYSRFALAGAISCAVTHGGLTPVDV